MKSLPDFLIGNWLQRYHVGFQSVIVGSFGLAPIPPVTVPYLFVERYVRISIDAVYKKSSWKYAGKIYQTVTTQLGFDDVIATHNVEIGKPEIMDMTTFPDGYKLKLVFPTWFQDVDIVIHEYVGNTSTPNYVTILTF